MTSTSERPGGRFPRGVAFGVSVAGPAHVAAGTENQDAWACTRWQVGRSAVQCAVVCDGLGSRPQGGAGARAGVRAARQAVRHWSRAPGSPAGLLVRLVEVLWRLEVAPLPPEDGATTCLVVVTLEEDGGRRIVMLALGDGVAVVERAEGLVVVGGRGEEAFGNVTVGLGTPHHMNDWQVQDFKTSGPVRVLLLSDGIADDVPLDNLPPFLRWLADLEGRPAQERGRVLRRSLRQWPVPGHIDDKTLVYVRLEGVEE